MILLISRNKNVVPLLIRTNPRDKILLKYQKIKLCHQTLFYKNIKF